MEGHDQLEEELKARRIHYVGIVFPMKAPLSCVSGFKAVLHGDVKPKDMCKRACFQIFEVKEDLK